jgi:hypothetical protein
MTADPDVSVPWQTPVAVDGLEPSVYRVLADGSLDTDTWRKTVVAPPMGEAVFYVRLGPGASSPRHWHPSDTVYIVRKGELVIPGEGSYREGEVRWVRGGTAYGPEMGGPDGVEFGFVSIAPFGTIAPDHTPPPARAG